MDHRDHPWTPSPVLRSCRCCARSGTQSKLRYCLMTFLGVNDRVDITYEIAYASAITLSEVGMTALKASTARANLYRLIDEAADSHEPLLITGKRASAVLVSVEDWRAIQETLFLVSIPGMRESIRKGLKTSLKHCAKELRW